MSRKKNALTQAKRKMKIMMIQKFSPTPMPQNSNFMVKPSVTFIHHQTFAYVSSSQQKPPPSTWDLRKWKCVIKYLTIEIEGMAIYRGMAPERLDHYIDNLLFMADAK